MDLDSVIKRLGEATEGSVEIDAAILYLISPPRYATNTPQLRADAAIRNYKVDFDRCGQVVPFDEWISGPNRSPKFTSSLDVAVSLVPEGMFWYVQSPSSYQIAKGQPFTAAASVKGKYGWADSGPSWRGEAPTAAAALCIAALRANFASKLS